MQEPKRPWPPYKGSYQATADRKYIYYFKEKLESYDGDDYDDPDDENRDHHMKLTDQQSKLPKKEPEKTSLAWLMTQVPEGVKPEDIKIELGAYTSRERYENHHVGFYYEVKIPSRMKQFKLDQAKFEADMAQYEKDIATYKAWQLQEEIRKAEEKLKQLKGVKV